MNNQENPYIETLSLRDPQDEVPKSLIHQIPAFVINPRANLDRVEFDLADWVLQARSKKLWSLTKQIEMLKHFNAALDQAIERQEDPEERP